MATQRPPDWTAPTVLLQPLVEAAWPLCQALATELDLPLAPGLLTAGPGAATDPADEPWQLQVAADGTLSLRRPDGVTLTLDFLKGRTRRQGLEKDLARQPLARALGLKAFRAHHGRVPNILDACAGLGTDAWLMASLGCSVTCLERHPVVYALLAEATARARADRSGERTAKRLSIVQADVRTALGALTPEPDVIYLDPMYPVHRRRAAVKKPLQFLQALLGPPVDANDVLEAALHSGIAHVVVKRPAGAASLQAKRSGVLVQAYRSPGTRYDVYRTGGASD